MLLAVAGLLHNGFTFGGDFIACELGGAIAKVGGLRWLGWWLGLVGVLSGEEGAGEDFEVEGEGPVFEIPEVEFDAFGEVGLAAVAVDLGPAGEAGFVDVSPHVAADVVFELFDEEGAFGARADEAHFAFEDVPELWEFVYVEAAEEGADGGAAGVVGGGPDGAGLGFGVYAHGAEFVEGEDAAFFAAALLFVEDGAGGAAFDGEGGDGDDGEGEG